jgi:hypothetical protein
VVFANVTMWYFFSKALSYDTSIPVVAVMSVQTVTNFFISALGGRLFFKEHVSIEWTMGASLALLGLGFIQYFSIK